MKTLILHLAQVQLNSNAASCHYQAEATTYRHSGTLQHYYGKDQFAKHVEQSLVLYKGGKYAESLAALQAAYSLRKQPRLLCNMARTYRKLGDDKSALQNYRACLQQDRSLPVAQRADIEHYIDELEALLNPDTQKQKDIIGKAITAGDHTTPAPPANAAVRFGDTEASLAVASPRRRNRRAHRQVSAGSVGKLAASAVGSWQ
jgi:tetratricopeptide (TPR) repeat protein